MGFPEDNCCVCGKGSQLTCATHPCPYAYNPLPDKVSSTDRTDENCCQATCRGYVVREECPDGLEIREDQAESTDVSDENCCQHTTTTTTAPPFEGPGKAQYVRYLPQTWSRSIAMRAAVIVGDDMEIIDPPEEMRSYSSVLPKNNQYVQEGTDGWPGSIQGRSKVTGQRGRHAWLAKHNRVGEWMEIDLGKNMDVRGVVMVGRPAVGCTAGGPHYISSVKIQTATTEDPTNFEARDGDKVWNTEGCRDKGTVRITFAGVTQNSTRLAEMQEHLCLGHSTEKQGLSDADAILKAHNYLRCLHGQVDLAWDAAVATNAQTAADQSCAVDQLTHSDSYSMTPPAGENLALGASSPDAATVAWYNEIIEPGYAAGDWGDEAVADGTAHFTALIWNATTKLGCANCMTAQGKKVWACQYAGQAPNMGDQAKWLQNVPQGKVLQANPETCCARVYSAAATQL